MTQHFSAFSDEVKSCDFLFKILIRNLQHEYSPVPIVLAVALTYGSATALLWEENYLSLYRVIARMWVPHIAEVSKCSIHKEKNDQQPEKNMG